MMKCTAVRGAVLLLALVAMLTARTEAQTRYSEPAPEELSRTLTALDAAVFDAFNRCDPEKFATYFADDVEFYHDKGGLSRSRQTLVDSLKNNICGKVRREVVLGSLEVYAIPGYGAVQMGVHRFFELSAGKDAAAVGIAKFTHVWRQEGGAWKITRVISYDHGPAPK
jgi:hypothetical protein